MKTYSWKGVSLNGKKVSGQITSKNQNELKEKLLGQEIALLSYKEKNKNLLKDFLKKLFTPKINLKNKFLFFEQFYLLVNSGIEVLKALEILKNQAKNKNFKEILTKTINNIKQGQSIAESLKTKDNIFEPFIINLIDAGEKSGKLPIVLKSITKNFEQRVKIKNKINNAALLPTITLTFAGIIVWGLFIFVIPQFESFFTSLNKELPKSTQLVFKISSFLRSEKLLPVFLIFLFILILIKHLLRLKIIKQIKDKLAIKIFFIDKIFINYDLLNFFKTISICLNSGVDMQQSLQLSIQTIKNSYLKSKLNIIKKHVYKGESLKDSIEKTALKYFNENIVSLIEIGEKTGKLDLMLKKASSICSDTLNKRLKIITTIFQPILLIIVGLIIVFLMLSVYLPIFGMAGIL
jgi:type IV pilus assembly protein PilC